MVDTSNVPAAKRSLPRRIFRWVLIVAAVLLFADFVLLPFGIAVYAAWPARAEVGQMPDGFSAVDLNGADGTRLSAWYAPTQNGAAIIVVPFAGGTRAGVRDQAILLAEHGFGVLAFDPRGAGESDGQTNRFGWEGTDDVGGAVAFLAAQPDVRTIGGWGLSMGGEVLLGAVGAYPQIAAVVADGATSRCYEEKFDLESARGPLVQFHTWLTYKFLELLTGDAQPVPMLDSISAAGSAHLLLIAAGADPEESSYAGVFAAAAGDRADVWVVPGVGHMGGWGSYRDEYTRRVLDFFSQSLLAGAPAD